MKLIKPVMIAIIISAFAGCGKAGVKWIDEGVGSDGIKLETEYLEYSTDAEEIKVTLTNIDFDTVVCGKIVAVLEKHKKEWYLLPFTETGSDTRDGPFHLAYLLGAGDSYTYAFKTDRLENKLKPGIYRIVAEANGKMIDTESITYTVSAEFTIN